MTYQLTSGYIILRLADNTSIPPAARTAGSKLIALRSKTGTPNTNHG
jgi:hypothetical protein